KKHPLLTFKCENNLLEQAFRNWENYKLKQIKQLKMNEIELNDKLIDLYGLTNEANKEVNDKFITLKNPDEKREIKSFISYAIGCIFGRYSLYEDGLIYAGGDFNPSIYKTFLPNSVNIIPITEKNYFEN